MKGIGIDLVDTDALFEELTIEPVVANDFNVDDPEEMSELDRALIMRYTSDTIESNASCGCGRLTEQFNVGVICSECGTPVTDSIEQPIQSDLWIKAPEGISGLILPEVYIILQTKLTQSKFNYLRWLIDNRYVPEELSKTASAVNDREKMEEQFGKHRGYNFFIDNFEYVMEFILTKTQIVKSKKERSELALFIKTRQHLFFPKHLPVPSKFCFVIEETTSGIYVDKALRKGIDGIKIMAQTSSPSVRGNYRQVAFRVVKCLECLSEFYREYVKVNLSKKAGAFRKHVFGGRLYFTGRAVITSLWEPHSVNDIHIPYGMAVQLLEFHIVSKLLRRGMTANEALGYVHSHVAVDSPLMWEILDELMAETLDGKGFDVIFTRNPSLRRGSTQGLRAAVIKRDLRDLTISMSVNILADPNADFDGDMLNLTLIIDQWGAKRTKKLRPALWVLSTNVANKISGKLMPQGPVLETTAAFIEYGKRRRLCQK